MTSHDCVIKIRKLYGLKKVGHTGTLDPEVEGVLPICIGQATKIVPYLTAMKKTYIAEVTLGIATETEDAHGIIVSSKPVENHPTKEEIEHVLQSFTGEITQIPPMYSAVRVNGKRLYEYARANEYVERPSRQVTIFDLEKIPVKDYKPNTFSMMVNCSQGTYIRTLCVDIGKKLGFPAHMSDLTRIESSSFLSEETFTFEQIEAAKKSGKLEQLLSPIRRGLLHLDYLEVDLETKKKVLHGQKFPTPKKKLKTSPFTILHKEQVIAIYKVHPDDPKSIKPIRVFNRQNKM